MEGALTELEQTVGAHLPVRGDRLRGRVALVSGAGSAGDLLGTGAATALLFAGQGADVAILDLDRMRGENTLRLIEQLGGRGLVVTADIRDGAACAAAVDVTVKAFGGIDVLMNNTGVGRSGKLGEVSEADWDFVVDVNLKGTMLLSQAALPHLAARKGAVINVSSVAAQRAHGSLAYAAAKGGLFSMTRDMAYACGPAGVRVNCLVPGYLTTPMGGGGDAKMRDERRKATFLGTEGSGWDIAWAALFLAGPEARWITAQVLNVDAGSTAASNLPRLALFKN
jgi:NAD(P)-dependent dehydrogenase (short-subunit alcohol dehydrogenase family)